MNMQKDELIERIKKRLADGAVSVSEMKNNDVMVVVNKDQLATAMAILKNDSSLQFATLMSQSGVDYKDKLAVIVNLYSALLRRKITVKAFLDRENPEVESLLPLFRGIDWYERETYDMFGIRFLGHSNLKRLLLPDDWEGFPLRKDYVYPSSYNGIDTGRTDLLDDESGPAREAHV
jgi:NADH-quinone oxidoreductase subunit C